uniref:Uncharacterized protein n=1 Tax=Anguilla anguilla TaxID=7936 RepID=A0A0E9PZ45_ANGAN
MKMKPGLGLGDCAETIVCSSQCCVVRELFVQKNESFG